MRTKLIQNGMKALLTAALFIFASLNLSGQGKIKANGTVIDENKLPMIGVGVIVKGTQTGTTTDLDGTWALDVPEGATLEFNCIGM